MISAKCFSTLLNITTPIMNIKNVVNIPGSIRSHGIGLTPNKAALNPSTIPTRGLKAYRILYSCGIYVLETKTGEINKSNCMKYPDAWLISLYWTEREESSNPDPEIVIMSISKISGK